MHLDQIIFWHKKGFIPGPDETEDSFVERCELTQKLSEQSEEFFLQKNDKPPFPLNERVSKPLRHWSKHLLLNRFDLLIDYVPIFFSSKKLSVIQGGATWFLENQGQILPLVQISKFFQKGSFLKIYTLDEILAHEAVHAARIAFYKEKIFEEYLAYLTANSGFRRFFGPLFRSPKEGWAFLFPFCLGSMVKVLANSCVSLNIASVLLGCSIAYFGYVMIRLTHYHVIFSRCFKKLQKIFKTKEKSLSVMVRLTDKEIIDFSKMDPTSIWNSANAKQASSLRWKVILQSYQ